MRAKSPEVEMHLWSPRLDRSVLLIANELDDEIWSRHGRALIVTNIFETVEGSKTTTHADGRAVDGRISFRSDSGELLWYLPLDAARAAANAVNERLRLTDSGGRQVRFPGGTPMRPVVVHQDPRDGAIWHFHAQTARPRIVVRIH